MFQMGDSREFAAICVFLRNEGYICDPSKSTFDLFYDCIEEMMNEAGQYAHAIVLLDLFERRDAIFYEENKETIRGFISWADKNHLERCK